MVCEKLKIENKKVVLNSIIYNLKTVKTIKIVNKN